MGNAEILTKILKTLFIKISRRTNEKNAIVILNKVINNLKDKYSYISLIEVNDANFKENIEYFQINNINLFNQLSQESLDNCIKEIFELTIKYLQRDADYFFIREFKEAINKYRVFNV